MFETALAIDVCVLASCALILLKYGRLSHSHPASIYLFFHFYTFTLRLTGLILGAPTLFTEWGLYFDPVKPEEIVRAAVLADVALAVMTIAWIRASIDHHKRLLRRPDLLAPREPNLKLSHIWSVVAVSFPLGVFGLWAFTTLPGVSKEALELGEWQTSSWFFITQIWAGLALLALIYWYGFRWWLLIPMGFYLLIMTYQGFHRFRVIIPALLLMQIFLDRRKLRWPPVYVLVLLVSLMAVFFPLKDIGRMAQQGERASEILDYSTESVNAAVSMKAPDQQFLDQFASGLTLIDDAGQFYYGQTYLALITLPVPRQWWPGKPGLADYLIDISRPWRPMGEAGMIVTFLGESYANFGYVGILIIPFLLAYCLGRVYFHAYRNDYYSVARLSYLLIACNLLQVFRDGLSSIVVFTWVNMMPLMVIVALHVVLPARRAAAPAASGAALNSISENFRTQQLS